MNIVQSSGTFGQTYAYDAMWRMTNVTSAAGQFGYLYNFQPSSSLVSGITLPNGSSIGNNYDAMARLLATKLLKSDNSLLDTESYAYEPNSYRTQQVFITGHFMNYSYDKIGQLKTAFGKEPGGSINRLQEQFSYAYDQAGNLSARTNNQFAEALTVDNLNQLTNIAWNGTLTLGGVRPTGIDIFSAWYLTIKVIPPFTVVITVNNMPGSVYYYSDNTFATSNSYALTPGENDFPLVFSNSAAATWTNTVVYSPVPNGYQYDQNGNLTNDGYRSFAYDQENQLTNITALGDWESTFAYDGLGRRRIEQDFSWQTGGWVKTTETHYVYDRNLLVQERDSANNVLVTYTRGLDLGGGLQSAGGIGGLLARSDQVSGLTAFYHSDGSGNIMAMVNGSQNLVAQYLYNPYGQIEGQWGGLAGANTMQFSSMPYHALSGLSLYPFRAYDPNLQRWLNHDPIGERGGINLYGFVGNDPINLFDSLGLLFGQGGDAEANPGGVNGPVNTSLSMQVPGYTPPPQPYTGPWLSQGDPNAFSPTRRGMIRPCSIKLSMT